MRLAYLIVDILVVLFVIVTVTWATKAVGNYSDSEIQKAKRAEKRQADLSPDEYIALMKEKAKAAGIKQRRKK